MRKAPKLASLAFLAAFFPSYSGGQDYDKTIDLPVDKPVSSLESKLNKAPDPPNEQGDDKPPTFYGSEIKSENNTLYYVIDVSGSMEIKVPQFIDANGDVVRGGNRLDRAKVELVRSIRTLPPNIRFNTIGYDDKIYAWRDVKKLYDADDATKANAITWVQTLQPWGCTATAKAVGVALAVKENKLVILLTDGAPNGDAINWCGNVGPELHREDIRLANTQKATINVYGIDATGIFRKFCVDVAADNGGSYTDLK